MFVMLLDTILVVYVCRKVASDCSLHDPACFANTWKVLSGCLLTYNTALLCDYVNTDLKIIVLFD